MACRPNKRGLFFVINHVIMIAAEQILNSWSFHKLTIAIRPPKAPAGVCVSKTMKPYAAKFYKSSAWLATRAAYIKARPLCEDCLDRGIYTPAEIVHHMKEITPSNIDDPTITLSFNNLRSVCRECHAKRHGARVKRYKLDELGRVTAKE